MRKQPFPLQGWILRVAMALPIQLGERGGEQASRVPVIWYILSVNLHGLCTQHTVYSATWDEAFAQLLSPFLAGLCFRSWASKAKLVFEGEGGKLGRQKNDGVSSYPFFHRSQ